MYIVRGRCWARLMLTGTLTLFCLDLSEGTKLLEFMPAVAHRAIAACNELARELADANGGEIHSELGLESSMLIAFPLASACVETASAIHRHVISNKGIPTNNVIRSAILTGEISGDESDDEVLRSLRSLTDLARPGQILVGESTHAIVRYGLSEGHGFLNLGLHHLDDGGRGQSLFQLLHPELPSDFQLLPSLLSAASNLPRGRTPFVGRSREI